MDVCGGAARGLPSHDADFVVSHPTKYRSRLKTLAILTCLHAICPGSPLPT